MGKIKGWSKIEDTNNKIIWKCDDGERMIVSVPKNKMPSNWIVGADGMLHIRKFNNKKDAVEFAVNYMRERPRCL